MAFSVELLNPPINIPTPTPAPNRGGPVAFQNTRHLSATLSGGFARHFSGTLSGGLCQVGCAPEQTVSFSMSPPQKICYELHYLVTNGINLLMNCINQLINCFGGGPAQALRPPRPLPFKMPKKFKEIKRFDSTPNPTATPDPGAETLEKRECNMLICSATLLEAWLDN